nr:6-carboxytetrahydropterin synthase [uncultured Lacibacter sp.]
MLLLTKIFDFETAHAIDGYNGMCRNIHGHSYQLHVTVGATVNELAYLPAPGFLLDFKDLKSIVQKAVVDLLDHKLVLSHNYISQHPEVMDQENLVAWDAEPTAENLLLFIKRAIQDELPDDMKLTELRLYETKNSYATWKEEVEVYQGDIW